MPVVPVASERTAWKRRIRGERRVRAEAFEITCGNERESARNEPRLWGRVIPPLGGEITLTPQDGASRFVPVLDGVSRRVTAVYGASDFRRLAKLAKRAVDKWIIEKSGKRV